MSRLADYHTLLKQSEQGREDGLSGLGVNNDDDSHHPQSLGDLQALPFSLSLFLEADPKTLGD